MGRPKIPAHRKRDRLSTTIDPETMRRITAAAAQRGITLGAVIDDLVRRSPAYFRDLD